MALETITNAAAAYHEPIKTKTDVKVESVQNSNTNAGAVAKETRTVSNKENAQDASYNDQQEQQSNPNLQKRLKSAVNHANTNLKYTRCEFSYHEETKRVSIRVLDKDTGEIIREIPPEESLDLVEKIWELAGIVVDEKR